MKHIILDYLGRWKWVFASGFVIHTTLIQPTYLLNLERFVILVLFQTTFLGTVFFSLTGLPHSPADQRHFKDQLRCAFFGLLWGFSIPGCFFLAQGMPSSFAEFKNWQVFLLTSLTILTVAGWFRSESLVLRRAQQVERGALTKRVDREKGGHRPREKMNRGFGGLPFYFSHVARTIGLLGLAIVCLNWSVFRFFLGPDRHQNSLEFTASQVHFVVPIMTALAGVVALMQLRNFRSLPLSRFQVTGILVLWPVAFGVGFGFVVIGLHRLWFGGAWIWNDYVGALIGASLLLLLVPILLRFGFSLKSFLVMFVLFPLMQILRIFEEQIGLDTADFWILFVILVPAVFVLTFYLLGTAYPWREGSLVVKRMLRH